MVTRELATEACHHRRSDNGWRRRGIAPEVKPRALPMVGTTRANARKLVSVVELGKVVQFWGKRIVDACRYGERLS